MYIPRISPSAFIALLMPPLLSSCSGISSKSSSDEPQQPAVSVKVMSAKQQTISESTVFTATVKSRASVPLSPQIEGQIRKIFVASGQFVKTGTPMIEISPEKQKASFEGSEVAIDSAQRDLNSAKHTLKSLEMQRVGKKSNLELASSFRDKYKVLAENGAVSKMENDQRANAYDAAQSDLDANDAQINAQKELIEKYERQVQLAKANMRQEQETLKYYTIRAPIDGVVGDIPVKVGNFVNTSTVLTGVTQNKPLEVYVEIPVERVHEVHMQAPIELLDSRNQKIGISRVFFIAPNVSSDSQTVLVKAQYPNSTAELKADETVRAKVIWRSRPGVTVPTEAVSHQAGEEFIYLADKDGSKYVAKQIEVKLGDIEGSSYQVIKGVQPGDQIIISGIQNLSDKTPIVVSQ